MISPHPKDAGDVHAAGIHLDPFDAPPFDEEAPNNGAETPEADHSTEGERPWPRPDPAMFYGLLGRTVRELEPYSEADPVGVLASLIVPLACFIGPTPRIYIGNGWHGARLYACLVGSTSSGRKGTARDAADGVLDRVDPWFRSVARANGGLSSGEGILYPMRDPLENDPGSSDKRLCVTDGELSRMFAVLKREGNTLSGQLRDLWDRGDGRILNKNSPLTVTGGHLCVLGNITQDVLRRSMDDAPHVYDGLGNRWLWLLVKKSKRLPEPAEPPEAMLASLAKEFERACGEGRTVGRLKLDDDARAEWRRLYAELDERPEGVFGALTARAVPMVARIALVHAVLDCSSTITTEHLRAASALWRYAEDSVRYLWGEELGDPVADAILDGLRQAGTQGMTRTEIRDWLGRNRGQQEIARALRALAAAGLAHKGSPRAPASGRGRPAETWIYARAHDRNDQRQ